MSTNAISREQHIHDIEQQIYLFTIQTELFKHHIAEEMKINNTDLACACLLALRGPHTAGQLAHATSLTTGAITTVIDRLEQAGYARRKHDPKDRRRIVVELSPTGIKKLQSLFSPIDLSSIWKQYADEEILTIGTFFARLTEQNIDPEI